MNKIYSFAVAMCIGLVSVAQGNEQIQNKKGVDIMPVKGEYAIGLGMDLGVATGFIGNMFGGYTGSNEIDETFINNPIMGAGTSIFGKYMLTDNNALRVGFYNNGYDEASSYESYNDRANDPDSMVVDVYRENFSSTYVSAGYEWRRGKSRLKGVYGVDAVLSWSNYHENYSYGNSMSLTNLTPNSEFSNWGGAFSNEFGRITEYNQGATFGIGARAFAGVEYYVAPKICIGTEFGWRLMMSKTGKSTTMYEKFDPFTNDGSIVTHTDTDLGSRSISSGIDNFNTQVYFHFYF